MSDKVKGVPKDATGSIESFRWKDGRTVTFRARVRAYGQQHRITFGTNHQGWSEPRAQVELDRILRQIERGTWEPSVELPPPVPERPPADETFHLFASRWWNEKRDTLSENARADYRWRLDHLLGHFHRHRVRAIDRRAVDTYRAKKVAERGPLEEAWSLYRAGRAQRPTRKPLSNRSINMTIDLLAQLLDDAVEYGQLDANPARGRKRRLPAEKRRRSFLEPDMVVDLLEAASHWEAELPAHQRYGRRALLAALTLAGPRVSELTEAPRADLDLAGGRIRLGKKTQAGLREVELTAFLQAELRSHLASLVSLGRPEGPEVPVFPTYRGGVHNPSNLRTRLLATCVARANEKRAAEGKMLLPHVTPHTLRRTFASLALTAGRDPRWVMGQLGHTDARFTLTVYAQVMQRQRIDYELVWSLMRFADERESWDLGGRVAPSGRTFETTIETTGPEMPPNTSSPQSPKDAETPADAGASDDGRGWFRTSDLSRVKRALSH
jgi:integrase